MRLDLDHRTGLAVVSIDSARIELRRPTLIEWCGWHDRADELLLLVPGAAERVLLDLLDTLAPSTINLDLNHTSRVAVDDPEAVVALVTFFRDAPLSPWLNAADPEETGGVEEARVLRSELPGSLGARAVLYRALSQLAPGVIDQMELWQIAALAGLDDAARRPAPGQAPRSGTVTTGDDGMGSIPGAAHSRRGRTETYRWGRRPGLPFLFSTLGPSS